nr:tetraacyldisaccharide 4'-kinase [Bacteroidota bacterium]
MKLLSFLLFPFALIYGIITLIRNKFFDWGILKSTAFDFPIISVGNLTVGGTGKTPQIEYLVRLLKKEFMVATLSRGYGRKTSGFVLATDKS